MANSGAPRGTMIWEYSDGTKVELGGRIIGDSPFAQDLRRILPLDWVELGPHPSPSVPLDPSDATHLDVWLNGMAWIYRAETRLVRRPKNIPPLIVRPSAVKHSADIRY